MRGILTWMPQRTWLVLPFLAIPGLWTYHASGMPVTSDGAIHIMRLVLLDYAVQHGLFLPRWLTQAAFGLGDPALGYYWLSGYYLSELIHLATGLDYVASMRGAFVLLVILGGGGALLLARDLFGRQYRWSALVAAVAYMYSPYLLTTVMIRGALGEMSAMALLPWVLWSLRRSLRAARPGPYVLATALSLGCLAISHNTTLFLAPPLLLAYVGVLWWQDRTPLARLRWVLLGLLGAMGISAFLWLPGLGDRIYFSTRPYQNARIYLPASSWQWTNWLDTTLRFDYTFTVPFQLGLVQVALALAGFFLARRRDAEWIFLFCAALLSCLAIGAWALPLWLGSNALTMVQFPWRLLTIASLPLALLTGGCVLRLRKPTLEAGAGLLLMAAIIYANTPRLDHAEVLDTAYGEAGLPQVAHWERSTGWTGLTPLHEFAPRWAASDVYTPTLDIRAGDSAVAVLRASMTSLRAAVTSGTGDELRLATLYFPGWQVLLDGENRLAAYPSTDLGLLTVQVPAGTHQLDVVWVGTPLQRWAAVLSLLSLAGLAAYCWRWSGRRWLAAVPLALLLVGAAANYWPESQESVRAPAEPIRAPGVTLVGYRAEQDRPDTLYVYPYWLIKDTPDGSFRVRWLMKDVAGTIVSEVTSLPYFGSAVAEDWPAGTLVDDAYAVPLPAGVPAGTYGLFAEILPDGKSSGAGPHAVGEVEIAATPSAAAPMYSMAFSMGDASKLVGYDVQINRQRAPASQEQPLVARPGDVLEYTLYWQAVRTLDLKYRSYLHIASPSGRNLYKEDHWMGGALDPSTTWNTINSQTERYRVMVPRDAPTGIYTPHTAMYTPKPIDLLPVYDGKGNPSGDEVQLRSIKVVDHRKYRPQNAVTAQLGDVANLLGYDLAPDRTTVARGSQLRLTLYYRATQATPANYTRFAHLYREGSGMAAQTDNLPQNGDNPTFAWAPGEIIRDEAILNISPDAPPGDYSLRIGFYDSQAGGARLPLQDLDGRPLPDNQVQLTTLTVQ